MYNFTIRLPQLGTILLSSILLVVFSFNILDAGGFSPNVQVNPEKEGRINLWGGNAVGVGGETIYALWTDFNMNVEPPHSHTYISKSTDEGVTFNEGVRVDPNSNQFFSSMRVDGDGNVYVVWTDVIAEEGIFNGISFSKSTDGAENFSSPLLISPDGVFPSVVVDGNNVYLSFLLRDVVNEGEYNFAVMFARSTDGGVSFEQPYAISDAEIPDIQMEGGPDLFIDDAGHIYCVWNDGRRDGDGTDIYIAKSTDNGVSFGTNVPVSDITLPNNRAQFGSSVAAFESNVYVVWIEENEAEERQVLFSKSGDGGGSFGEEKTFYAGGMDVPAIAVNNEGEIYIAYPGIKLLPHFSHAQWGLFCDVSIDGGESFTATESISDIDEYANNPSIFVDDDDVIYAVWTDERTEKGNVFFSKGTFSTKVVSVPRKEFPSNFRVMQNYPNPFNPATTIGFELPASATVVITIYDVMGRKISELKNENLNAGYHQVVWDASNQPSGVYLYKIHAVSAKGIHHIGQRKMILIK